MLWSLMIHDQVRWVPFRFVNHTGCHTAHHWYFRYNYGNYFTFWDRLCGTYFDPEELPEQFIASKQALLGGGVASSGGVGVGMGPSVGGERAMDLPQRLPTEDNLDWMACECREHRSDHGQGPPARIGTAAN